MSSDLSLIYTPVPAKHFPKSQAEIGQPGCPSCGGRTEDPRFVDVAGGELLEVCSDPFHAAVPAAVPEYTEAA